MWTPRIFVALRFDDELHEAARIVHDERFRHLPQQDRFASASDAERRRPHVCNPHGGHRGVREHRMGDGAVVHREPAALERVLGGDVSFLRRGRFKHRLAFHVAASKDVRGGRPHLRIDLDALVSP